MKNKAMAEPYYTGIPGSIHSYLLAIQILVVFCLPSVLAIFHVFTWWGQHIFISNMTLHLQLICAILHHKRNAINSTRPSWKPSKKMYKMYIYINSIYSVYLKICFVICIYIYLFHISIFI